MRPLDALLSPPEQRLLGTILSRPDHDFGTVELLQHMGSSRSAGSSLIKRWVDAGLLREKRIGNQRRIAANPNFVLYTELRSMVRKTVGIVEPLAHALAPVASRLTDAFVFGSVAKGIDTSDSDIDVALVGDVDLFDVSLLLDTAQSDLGRHVHANIYSISEWSDAIDPVLEAIKGGPRIDLMGALNDQAG